MIFSLFESGDSGESICLFGFAKKLHGVFGESNLNYFVVVW
jgi:hypothetical protein